MNIACLKRTNLAKDWTRVQRQVVKSRVWHSRDLFVDFLSFFFNQQKTRLVVNAYKDIFVGFPVDSQNGKIKKQRWT